MLPTFITEENAEFQLEFVYIKDGIFVPVQADRFPGLEGGGAGAVTAQSSRTSTAQPHQV